MTTLAADTLDQPRGVTPGELRAMFGWSEGTLHNRTRDGVAVKVARGRYDVAATLANELERLADQRTADPERVRLLRAKATAVELGNRERRGELLERSDVAGIRHAALVAVRAVLDPIERELPARLVGVSDPAEARAVVQDQVRAARTAAAEALAGGD